MRPATLRRIERRVAYGRAVRSRAEALIAAHGPVARAAAQAAARDPGAPEPERRFWQAVADRVDRLQGQPVWTPLFGVPEEAP